MRDLKICTENKKLEGIGLMMSMFKTVPGEEAEVIKKIEKKLADYKYYLMSTTRRYVETQRNRDYAQGATESYFANLYKPKSYYMFGNFDVATLILLDDFEVTWQLGSLSNTKGQQSIYGSIGEAESHLAENGVHPIYQVYDEGFDQEHPFMAASTYKFNSSHSILFGIQMLNLFRQYTLKLLKTNKLTNKCKIYFINTFGWHCFTILVFSNSLECIGEIISQFSELTLGEFFDILKIEDPLDSLLSKRGKTTLSGRLLNQMVHKCMKKKHDILNDDEIRKHYRATHLFATGYTNIGFSNNLDAALLESTELNEELVAITRIQRKPGHFKKAIEEIELKQLPFSMKSAQIPGGSKAKPLFLFGEYDLVGRWQETPKSTINSKSFLKNFLSVFDHSSTPGLEQKQKSPHIIETQTEVAIPYIHFEDHYDPANHIFYYTLFTDFLSSQRIQKVRKICMRARLPNHENRMVESILNSFNLYISDPLMLLTFLDVYPFINHMIELIEAWEDGQFEHSDVASLHEFLSTAFTYLDRVHISRLSSSYALKNTNDLTYEYKGGAHRILSCIDSILKSIARISGHEFNECGFSFIGALPSILVRNVGVPIVRLNANHLFQPSGLSQLYHELGHVIYKNGVMTEFWEKFESQVVAGVNIEEWGFDKPSTVEELLADLLADTFQLIWGHAMDLPEFSRMFWVLADSSLEKSTHNVSEIGQFFHLIFLRHVFIHTIFDPFNSQEPGMKLHQKVSQDPDFTQLVDRLKKLPPTRGYIKSELVRCLRLTPFMGKVLRDVERENKEEKKPSIIDGMITRAYVVLKQLTDPDGSFIHAYIEMLKFNRSRCEQIYGKCNMTREQEVYDKKLHESVPVTYQDSDEDEFERIRFTHFVLRSMVRYNEKLMGSDPDIMDYFLERAEVNNQPKFNRLNSPLLVDPAGGLFITGLNERKEYLGVRMAVILSLWDLAVKTKAEVLLQKMDDDVKENERK